ncbi:MAG: multifunctional oxoglutarate decarboxylase/oxoglutarate dehydrogenase thiamine pyrophosphate-binding subunit/dihydrolipoyllysine-residue succinyltransferase subunit [Acidobacteria bacterium]|nr:multifunctional oxoglutarate decarboxylase/oxoglutarate dehydrogenase thiamine pyrophosphate-binding subunit/dihydrolipoyllysine-residue succinyltransferase subunit [Acidobacteriota bacterium]
MQSDHPVSGEDTEIRRAAAKQDEGPAAVPSEKPYDLKPISGGNLRIVENMEASLSVPTATSYRTIPVKLLEENRKIINEYRDAEGKKRISFTHLISWAVVCALKDHPEINASFDLTDGVPHRRLNRAINLGIAVDGVRKDGTRTLLVPNIKNAEALRFPRLLDAYNDILERVRKRDFAPSDFQDTTVTLTNPGTVGTFSSVPRLVRGQGAVIATGIIGYPSEYHAWSSESLSSIGLSKVMNISCTYDHRIIQGAESGEFLGRVKKLLMGEDSFYERLFNDLQLPAVPIQWSHDQHPSLLGAAQPPNNLDKQAGVLRLINRYRVRGHMIAQLDPLASSPLYHPELDPATFGLTMWDLDREFSTGDLGGLPRSTLRRILEVLRTAYCKKIGIEFRHIQDPGEKDWIQQHIEPAETRLPLERSLRLRVLEKLASAEQFEKFLHLKFVGHKRFSLEGAETVISVLDTILTRFADFHVREAVLGMAHRGRLNVLANIIGTPVAKILSEFEENFDPYAIQGSGDVKYHLGSSGTFRSASGKEIFISLAPNPSHLEWVNPVIEGIVRAKQDRSGDRERERIVPLIVHGDAAFAGQGVAYETLNLSQLYGYKTGGTVHLIVNNQIGFTTPSQEIRSSPYATDLARSVQAPIFHVNGDDPDAAARIAILSVEYRQRFKKDVVIDIFCYRRHGHNETDEPSYTQPLLYRKIREKPSVLAIYSEKLLREGVISKESLEKMRRRVQEKLEEAYRESVEGVQAFSPDIPLAVSEEELNEYQPTERTGVGLDLLREVARGLSSVPRDFHVHPKLISFLEKRRELLASEPDIDWSFAEALAFGTLVYEGTPVRLSGQDSARGTFSQRHAGLTDFESGEEYIPLQNISPDQASFEVYDSLLSEAAVLGFEFGYSAADPLSLVLWEAQFGDFSNGAQVIIDNFISSSDTKWKQPCDLVLLLPHGFEGQGPEHSSARPERFLSLCAEDNMRVCFPTTPSQYFHLLRSQMRDAKQIPLVVLTPKSILRHPECVSRPRDLVEGRFEMVLDDPGIREDRADIWRVLLCSGKVYYDLIAERRKRHQSGIAIVRVEQLYPFPEWNLSKILSGYGNARKLFWVQEEPQNMGAWYFVSRLMEPGMSLGRSLRYIGRPESASPAAGSHKAHAKEQAKILREAFE